MKQVLAFLSRPRAKSEKWLVGTYNVHCLCFELLLFLDFSVIFVKADIPEAPEEKAEFAKKLMKYHVSVLEYSNAMKQAEIK